MVPGSQVTIRLIGGDGPNPDVVEIVETTVEDDRTFAASADFSQLTPGQRVEVEFASQNRLEGNRVIDKRSAYVVDNFENPARFQISSFAGDIQVQQRDALDELQATITNNGSIAGRQLIEFRIGGEPIRNETITIGSGGSETLDLSGQFVTLPTGTYQYTVATDDDQRTGQLTVGAPDTGTVITDTASQGATTSGQSAAERQPAAQRRGRQRRTKWPLQSRWRPHTRCRCRHRHRRCDAHSWLLDLSETADFFACHPYRRLCPPTAMSPREPSASISDPKASSSPTLTVGRRCTGGSRRR
jgi:hypothetical protein